MKYYAGYKFAGRGKVVLSPVPLTRETYLTAPTAAYWVKEDDVDWFCVPPQAFEELGVAPPGLGEEQIAVDIDNVKAFRTRWEV